MEDIVLSVIDRVIEQEKLGSDVAKYRHDVGAFVLNRIPPKYFTSERGLLHARLETRFFFQQRTDILLLVHEAIDIIKTRRDYPSGNIANLASKRIIFFSHIIGEVLEETTFSIIPEVKVLLMKNGQPAKMVDATWNNPYSISKATMGYYHFWPEPDEKIQNNKGDEVFEIKFSHPECKEKSISITVPYADSFDASRSKVAPITLLSLKDGADINFLYQ